MRLLNIMTRRGTPNTKIRIAALNSFCVTLTFCVRDRIMTEGPARDCPDLQLQRCN